ncbi:MAG: hypothetical protein EOO46_22190, partial [Flavobacterium sp.]
MKKGFFTILLFLPTLLFAQADSLKGHIKSIREKLIFLDSTKQNMKLFSSEGDYGHYGFSSPEFTFSRFNSWWFNTPWVHYLNYLRNYDTSKNLLEEIWYYKNDEVLERITYDYDEQNNLVQEKTEFDDTTFFVKSSYYNDLGLHLSSISYSSFKPLRYEYESYSYDENKRVIEIKNFDEYGESYGTKFNYTSSGKVKEKISHSPFVWVQLDKKSKGQKSFAVLSFVACGGTVGNPLFEPVPSTDAGVDASVATASEAGVSDAALAPFTCDADPALDTRVVDEACGVFTAPTRLGGANERAGSRGQPVATIQAALDKAQQL